MLLDDVIFTGFCDFSSTFTIALHGDYKLIIPLRAFFATEKKKKKEKEFYLI